MRTEAQVVIIGAGIVGSSTAYHLTRLGVRDVVVLDMGPLFDNWGSTSHAPGMMFQHNHSKSVTRLAIWSRELYAEVSDPADPVFFQVGSMEVASTADRWEELKRKVGQSMSWGLEAHLIGPDEAKKLLPIMRVDDIYGAFYVPTDCVIRGARTTEAIARVAEQRGAEFHAETPVTGLEVENGRVRAVVTPKGRIRTETVVSAAGVWGPLVGKLVGVHIPLTPMQHLFVKTGPLKELTGETDWIRLPILRHQDKDLYFRQYADAVGYGSYRHAPLPIAPEDMPKPIMLPFSREQFEESFKDAAHRIPAVAGADLVDSFNGIFSFTADGFSLLGESPDVRGFWSAEAVWITHAGGVGRAMAEWIVDGKPSIDMRENDINRFPRHAVSKSYIVERSNQSYIEVYDIVHQLQQMGSPRGLRVTPFYQRQRDLGAVFFESAGWERPQWYGANARLLKAGLPGPERFGWTAQNWSPIIGAEHRAVRERVGLFDLSAFTKLEVIGPNALPFLQRLTTNQMDQPIRKVTYTAMLDQHGGIVSDVTVIRLGAQRFLLITGGASGPRDLAWIRRNMPGDGSVQVVDVSSGWCAVGVWGPRARDLLRQVSSDDLSNSGFPYFTAREITVGYLPLLAARISYAGELGWELYAPTEYGQYLWDTIWEAGLPLGLIAAGGGAFDSLRLEKGYRLWGPDMNTEHTPWEAGIGFVVKPDKGDFIGWEAVLQARSRPLARKLSCMTFDDHNVAVMGKEPILQRDHVVSYVTSANYGYSVGKSIAYGYLPVDLTVPGTALQVQFYGRRYPVTVEKEPLFDRGNERIRA